MPKTFKDLAAFQRALDVAVAVYDVTGRFPRSELYGLASQVRRAAVRVVSDIAEGQGRLTYGDWRRLLGDARGSLYEVEAQCILAERLQYITQRELQELTSLIKRAGAALSGLLEWVRAQERRQQRPSQQPTEQPTEQPTQQPSNRAPEQPATSTRATTPRSRPAPPPRT